MLFFYTLGVVLQNAWSSIFSVCGELYFLQHAESRVVLYAGTSIVLQNVGKCSSLCQKFCFSICCKMRDSSMSCSVSFAHMMRVVSFFNMLEAELFFSMHGAALFFNTLAAVLFNMLCWRLALLAGVCSSIKVLFYWLIFGLFLAHLCVWPFVCVCLHVFKCMHLHLQAHVYMHSIVRCVCVVSE